MSRVVHFEINAVDPQRASAFYEGVFGWKFPKWDGPEDYWMVETGDAEKPGINGGLMKSQNGQPSTVITVEVDSVDAYSEKATAHGGQIVVPKMEIPGVGYIAYCQDPDGGLIGIFQCAEVTA